MSKIPFELKSYGVTTVGERGQIVIPSEIRKKLDLKKGDKFLVFSREGSMIAMIKPEKFDKILNNIIKHLQVFKALK
ncbi:MAG: AbrB/MazE/SpoVT family DNA-binding domain-containing protein [Patescibacteria group bacterium]|nr:AbrB/MazE/SpoVT family DNA-binding domain-containing protein [Patescibacteria group bacterium]